MKFIKEELSERISPDVVNEYLNIPNICIGEVKEVYAEVVRVDSKFTKDGNPFISFTLKDINGRVVSASMFDKTLDTETMNAIRTFRKVYAHVKYEAICFKSRVHLQVKVITILDSASVSEELAMAFTPIFKEREDYVDKIKEHSFGEYAEIYNLLVNSGIFDSLSNISFEEFGSAKIGAISRTVYNILERIDSSDLPNKYLGKIVALYSLIFYATSKPILSIGTDQGIVKSITKLSSQFNIFKQRVPSPLTDTFCEEVERVVLKLFGIKTSQSITSLSVVMLLENEKQLYELSSLSYSSPKGFLSQYKGESVINN